MSVAEEMLPNFFIVGAPKAGTTSLYHHLDQHPEVFMSPMKETSYFADEIRIEHFAPELRHLGVQNAEALRIYLDAPVLEKRFGGIVTEWLDYRRLFAGASGQRCIGEASPSYLWSSTAACRIAAYKPDAKIIIILRNPIERAFSQYRQTVITGEYPLGFAEHLDAALTPQPRQQISVLHPFLEYGLYADQVQRYLDHFPRKQVGIWLYEDLGTTDFLPTIFRFLSIDPYFRPDTTRRHLEQRLPRVRPLTRFLGSSGRIQEMRRFIPNALRPFFRRILFQPAGSLRMTDDERQRLAHYYRSDVQRLEKLIDRDLSFWM